MRSAIVKFMVTTLQLYKRCGKNIQFKDVRRPFVRNTKPKSESPMNGGSSPVKMVSLVLNEKEAIAIQMLASAGIAVLVKDIDVLPTMMRNIDKLFGKYFNSDEKQALSDKIANLCDAVSKDLMEEMNLSVAEWK